MNMSLNVFKNIYQQNHMVHNVTNKYPKENKKILGNKR